jgi:2-polyprenyl-3-methyl-5-hydroxy-6-metoxy-1,4-benzoquinol methylase
MSEATTTGDGGHEPRIAIIVVAYNAATTLAKVLDRIPHDFRHRISAVYVGDDHSGDSTHLVALGYQQLSELPLHVVRHERNLGYGGNQKAGYAWAHENGMDIVVLLHGDGQYAPEILPDIVAPLIEGRADAVFGSRMMSRGAARAGGMPMYKYVGNRILTSIENKLAGAELTEWHSGYRAYSVEALAAIPVERNSDGFDFDTEVIVQLIEAGRRIVEIPIPTYYGDEICHVNGMRYAKDVVEDVARYRLHKIGFGTGELAFNSVEYEHKHGANSSHSQLITWGTARPPGRVLDLGCGSGSIAAALREAGHHVVGVDLAPAAGIDEAVDEFVSADLDNGLPPSVTSLEPFDLVVAADVLEHVRAPEQLLADAHAVLAPGGVVLVSVPNFAHWYPRVRVAAGRFDYDRRGILDAGHVRFFTRRGIERLIAQAGYVVRRRHATGIPFDAAERGSNEPKRREPFVAAADQLLASVRPELFGYQLLYELAEP